MYLWYLAQLSYTNIFFKRVNTNSAEFRPIEINLKRGKRYKRVIYSEPEQFGYICKPADICTYQ